MYPERIQGLLFTTTSQIYTGDNWTDKALAAGRTLNGTVVSLPPPDHKQAHSPGQGK